MKKDEIRSSRGRIRNSYRILVENIEGKIRWEMEY
jgi:hypothetical protein